jgi:tRNA(Ile)-lysidine synthase
LIENTRRIIQKNQLIPPDTKLVVAVSGGADSLALLHILYTLQSSFGWQLHVATLDHGLRGEQGAADAAYVRQFAESLGVGVTVGKADVKMVAAQKKIGIEAAARTARYDFLAAVARESGVDRIVVGHHAGDQAETVLMHLLRGSGIRGLGGMTSQTSVPGHDDLKLIRPLLWASRAQIETYCKEQGLSPREDATNQDTTLLRNAIRHDILPDLQKLNANIEHGLGQLANIARVENDYIEQQLHEFVARTAVQRFEDYISVNRMVFRNLHPALQRRFITWAAREIVPHIEDLGYIHVVEAVAIGVDGGQGARALLVDGLQLRVDYDELLLERQDATRPESDAPVISATAEIEVKIPGVTAVSVNQWVLQASLTPILEFEQRKLLRLAIADTNRVTMRGRQEGDRFAPLGMNGHSQKLNRWMINRKIPQHLRQQIPLLCVDGNIAAIYMHPHWFVGEAYAIQDNSPRVVYFQFLQNL